MNLTIMTMNLAHTRTLGLRAAACAGALSLLASCGGGGGGSPSPPRFQAITAGGVAAIRDNDTGVVWAKKLETSADVAAGLAPGVAPTAQELLAAADLGEAVLTSQFGFLADDFKKAKTTLIQVADSVMGAEPKCGGVAWTVDFSPDQQFGGLRQEQVLCNDASPLQWRVLERRRPSGIGFFDRGDGTVERNGLQWSLCSMGAQYTLGGQCIGAAKGFTLAEAKLEASKSSLAGFIDWRLPTKVELQGLLSLGNTQLSLLAAPFAANDRFRSSTEPLQYWTRSEYGPRAPGFVWIVDFSVNSDRGGVWSVDPDSSPALVRLVRNLP